jgi:putative addiction module component (TIGR02574 family)
MGTKEILEQALKLKPEERFALVESLIRSLDEPNMKLDDIWAEEAEKRLRAYRGERLEVFRWRKYSRKNDASHFLNVCEAGAGRCLSIQGLAEDSRRR